MHLKAGLDIVQGLLSKSVILKEDDFTQHLIGEPINPDEERSSSFVSQMSGLGDDLFEQAEINDADIHPDLLEAQ